MRGVVSSAGFRADGRLPSEVRSVRCRLSVSAASDGSAELWTGLTHVLATVRGPFHERRAEGLRVTVHSSEFGRSEHRAASQRRDKVSARLIQGSVAVALAECSGVEAHIEVLQNDGSALSACINALCLSLIDAGVEMSDFVVSCSAALPSANGTLIDLTHSESLASAALTAVWLPKTKGLLTVDTQSLIALKQMEAVMSAAQKGCRKIHAVMAKAVKKHSLSLLEHRAFL